MQKGTGSSGRPVRGSDVQGYGPGGAAILSRSDTDNPTRTVAEIGTSFTKLNGNLGATNSVAWMSTAGPDYRRCRQRGRGYDARGGDRGRRGRRNARRDAFLITARCRGSMPSRTRSRPSGSRPKRRDRADPQGAPSSRGRDAASLLKLIEALAEMDDVAKVHSNFDIDAEAMAAVT